MNNYELVAIIEEAQEKLFEAIELLETYIQETGDQNAKAYIVDRLRIMASADHWFLSRDINLDTLKQRVLEPKY